MTHHRHKPPPAKDLHDLDKTAHKELSVEEQQLQISREELQVEQATMGFAAEQLKVSEEILHELRHPHPQPPTHIHQFFKGVSPMPVTLNVGQTVLDTISESNAAGPVAVVPASLTYVIDNTSVATVQDNGDGTATITAVSAGTANITVTDTVFSLTSTEVITVNAVTSEAPTTLTQTFGTPTP